MLPEVKFYAPHSGNGGTKIYEADVDRLQSWEQELTDLELRNHAARQKKS
jgi:hypothetical protein